MHEFMRYFVKLIVVLFSLSSIYKPAASQEVSDSSLRINQSYIETVSSKAEKIDDLINRKTEKILARFQKHQLKLIKKLSKVDSSAAREMMVRSQQELSNLSLRLKEPQQFTHYIPLLDTLKTSFRFLETHKSFLEGGGNNSLFFNKHFSKINSLENQFQKAEEIKRFLKQQRNRIRDELQKFGLAKQLKAINKDVYYYGEQIREYKTLLNDKKKVERKAIDLLSKTRLFQDFMKKHSVLASLFRMPPDDPTDPLYLQALTGLQTRVQVNQLIQQQISAGGPGALQQVQNNIRQAQDELLQLKDKMINKGFSSDDDIPDFKPNQQKTKSFLRRLEIGTNMQSQRNDAFFPVTSDIGLSLGYKLHDKGIIGIGGSYKIGWRTGFRHISVSSQGVGLRSFIDYQLKNTFWISGGFEMNYRSAFRQIEQLRGLNAWQQSGLVGISKKLAVNTKFFKSTKVQVLYDILSHQQIPKTPPVVFRVGYSLPSFK